MGGKTKISSYIFLNLKCINLFILVHMKEKKNKCIFKKRRVKVKIWAKMTNLNKIAMQLMQYQW